MTGILEGLDTQDLLQHMPASLRSSLEQLERAGTDWNAVGNLLAATPTAGVAFTGTGQWTTDLWQAVKWEFRCFLCTDSEPYAELRESWEDRTQRSSKAAVGSLARAIAAKLGVASGVVVPMVTWLVLVARRTGTDAVCVSLFTAPPAGAVLPRSSYT